MKQSSHVFLVGFMGSGKSTVGRIVADALGRPFVDLDEVVERTEGMSISEIFRTRGEPYFRELESAGLRALDSQADAVVACGGGIVLQPENREALRRLGTVVYLQVTAGEAVARVGDAGSRPLLSGPCGTLAATSILEARESLYRSVSDGVVDTVGKSPEEVAQEIIAFMEAR